MIVISNLAEKVDRRFLGENEKNLWNAIPYQTDNFDGVMLGGGDGVDLPPIEIDLSVKGKYRIWLGTYGFATRYKIRTKLSHDLCFQTLGPTYNPDPQIEYVPVLYELFWREADITGQNLILEGCHTPSYQGALAYIRLEPIEEFTGQGHCGKVEFPLAITNDGGGYSLPPCTENRRICLNRWNPFQKTAACVFFFGVTAIPMYAIILQKSAIAIISPPGGP